MPSSKPRVRRDLAVVELDGEAVVYDEASGELHHLNQTAALVFSLLDGSGTVKELARELAGAYGVPVEGMEGQLHDLVREFEKAQLLDPAPALSGEQKDR